MQLPALSFVWHPTAVRCRVPSPHAFGVLSQELAGGDPEELVHAAKSAIAAANAIVKRA